MNVHVQRRQLSMFLLLILMLELILFHQQDSKWNFRRIFTWIWIFLLFEFFVYIFLLVLFSIEEWNGQERTTFQIRQVQQLLLKISSLLLQFKDIIKIFIKRHIGSILKDSLGTIFVTHFVSSTVELLTRDLGRMVPARDSRDDFRSLPKLYQFATYNV